MEDAEMSSSNNQVNNPEERRVIKAKRKQDKS